jgi:hypothetical protein
VEKEKQMLPALGEKVKIRPKDGWTSAKEESQADRQRERKEERKKRKKKKEKRKKKKEKRKKKERGEIERNNK